jgi:ribosomal-protein-alanine N-acetyltransferase
LRERYWGRGIATRAVKLLVEYLYTQTDIEIITASTMVENLASERVLEKNDFLVTAKAVPEDWGYPEPTIADKWFR